MGISRQPHHHAESSRAVRSRGADTCFQVLTDHELKGGETITADFSIEGCEAVVYQLLTVTVPLNSDAKMLCTTDFHELEPRKTFVRRKFIKRGIV